MAELTFTKNAGGLYEATATVNGDFNIHIERAQSGSISINVSTVEDAEYQNVFGRAQAGLTFDKDFRAAVYPKYVQILSSSVPVANKNFITENADESASNAEGNNEEA